MYNLLFWRPFFCRRQRSTVFRIRTDPVHGPQHSPKSVCFCVLYSTCISYMLICRRVEGTTQWYTAVIVGYSQETGVSYIFLPPRPHRKKKKCGSFVRKKIFSVIVERVHQKIISSVLQQNKKQEKKLLFFQKQLILI